jgi:Uncharacterized protein with SCP/PR1 domains
MRKLVSAVIAMTLVVGGISVSVPHTASVASAASFNFSKEHQDVLASLNAVREKLGLGKLELDPYLTEAAQNHAEYLTTNKTTGHGEDPKKSGYTGSNATDRAKAVGYGNQSGLRSGVNEVVSYDDSTLMKTLDGFLNKTVVHRDFLLGHSDVKIGFGISGSNAVFNIGATASDVQPPSYFSYPYNGQKDVGTYFMGSWENPDPLKPFGVSKTGFVISYYTAEWADSFTAKITDSKGTNVPFFSDETGLVHLYPKQELKAGETYTVNVKYGNRNDTWSFTTKSSASTPTNPTTPTTPVDTSIGKQFADFQTGKYWTENMVWALEQGLIAGYEEYNPKTGKTEKLLKPATELSEAQFLTILFRHSESSLVMMTEPKDKKWWASQAYVIAEKLKLPTKGSHSNVKAANAPMTRGEMAVVLASYYNMKYKGGKALTERQAVQMMYDMKISEGYNDAYGNTPKTYESYGASKVLLREHVVSFMKRYDDYLKTL